MRRSAFELVMDAAQLPELDDPWIAQKNAPKAIEIGTQRVSQHERVTPIILGAGGGVPVTKAVELLWIDRENRNAALGQGFDDGAPRRFDADCELRSVAAYQAEQLVGQRRYLVACVPHRALEANYSLSIQHAHLMPPVTPVDANPQTDLIHFFSLLFLPAVP
jgi:hypothetical protein